MINQDDVGRFYRRRGILGYGGRQPNVNQQQRTAEMEDAFSQTKLLNANQDVLNLTKTRSCRYLGNATKATHLQCTPTIVRTGTISRSVGFEELVALNSKRISAIHAGVSSKRPVDPF